MSWLQKLYETYENCISMVGDLSERVPLLPICHTTQQAQITVVLNGRGEFLRGEAVPKEEASTVIPCTESSSSRTSGLCPHPLHDKLQYVAGDYVTFGGKEKKWCYGPYLEQLTAWCRSPYSEPRLEAVLAYLQKGCLIADLVAAKVLFARGDGTLMEKWEGDGEAPPIFKTVLGPPIDAFVRFAVEIPGVAESRLWRDAALWQSYIDYELSSAIDKDVCYVTGALLPCATLAPAKIRNAGDKAKLISGNDSSGFTYRGRFKEASQAYSVSFEVVQKAHNALRWLIARQGFYNGDQVVLTWGSEEPKKINPVDDPLSFFERDDVLDGGPTTYDGFAERFRKCLAGYQAKADVTEDIMVLVLDSATPGRLSVVYYRELKGSEFYDRIIHWHESCSWYLSLSRPKDWQEQGEKVPKWLPAVMAPSPELVATAAYGLNAKAELKKKTVERLLSCIMDGTALPRDLMAMAVQRASRPESMEDWEAKLVEGVACALVRKYYNDANKRKIGQQQNRVEERWTMALNEAETDRSYLFGRVLAYAEELERCALREAGENRETNAQRLRFQYVQHPAKTLDILYGRLEPYINRLREKANWYLPDMRRVAAQIPLEDYTDEPLQEQYLLGYFCQLNAFREEMLKRQEAKKTKAMEEE